MSNTIENIMAEKGTPSLKAIAAVFGMQPIRLYTVAKQPKAGEVYDAHVFNWDAIEKFIQRRLDPDKGPVTVDEVVEKALVLDEEFKATDGRTHRTGAGTGAKVEMIEVDGKQIQKRKYPNFEATSGKFFCKRKDPNVYAMIFQTVSHTVLRPVNQDGTYASEEMFVISNNMMNYQGVAEANIDQGIKDRFEHTGDFKIVSAPGTNSSTECDNGVPSDTPAAE